MHQDSSLLTRILYHIFKVIKKLKSKYCTTIKAELDDTKNKLIEFRNHSIHLQKQVHR